MKKMLICILLVFLLPLNAVAMSFSDIKPDFWAYQNIKSLSGLGVINGYPDSSFKPQGKVTRGEFIKMMALISDNPQEEKAINFLEDYGLEKHWAYRYVEICARKGLISPDETSATFDLEEIDKPILRAEMALLISRNIVDLLEVKETNFSDLQGLDKQVEEGVKKTYQHGIISGYPDGSFQPFGNSTRAEAVAMLDRWIDVLKLDKQEIKKNVQHDQEELKRMKEGKQQGVPY